MFSLCCFFLFWMMTLQKKESGVHFFVFANIMFSTCRIWLDVSWSLLVKWFIFRVSENHDKSGHTNPRNYLVCPHKSRKLLFKPMLHRLLGQSQFSREWVYKYIKLYSSATSVLAVRRILVLNVKVIREGEIFFLKASAKSCILWH